MTPIVLRNYQEEAVQSLLTSTKNLLTNPEKQKLIVFKAPTGSGKTVMMAKYIEAMKEESDEFCYLWLTIGKGNLHQQSRKKLDNILEGIPSVKLLEDVILDGEIKQNQVVVMNWEKLNNKKDGEWQNVLMREGEKTNFGQLLERTNKKRKVILIIDESHHSTNTATANELKDLIQPKIMIEVSATPIHKPSQENVDDNLEAFVRVKVADVIRDGIIKKEVLINDNLTKIDTTDKHKLEIAFEMAFEKRQSLHELYQSEKIPVKPLCLIQIPNSAEGEAVMSELLPLLKAKGVSVKKKNLAIWTSHQKENLDTIDSPTSKVDFLIFKTAIATGWDCPRAQVLFKLRDVKSDIFDIQTIGRILRMPEQKHYQNEELNKSYVYINNEDFEIKMDKEYTMVKHLRAKLKEGLTNIQLPSYSLHQKRENTFKMKKMKRIFEDVLYTSVGVSPNYTVDKNLSVLKDKGIEWNREVTTVLVSNEVVKSAQLDDYNTLTLTGGKSELVAHDLDIKKQYEAKIQDSPDFPFSKLGDIFIQIFLKVLGKKKEKGAVTEVQKFYLLNEPLFNSLFEEVAKTYSEQENSKKIQTQEMFTTFSLPTELSFNHESHTLASGVKGYAYDKCFVSRKRSKPEEQFELFLENHVDQIDWWMKNGDKGIDNFSIPYTYKEIKHAFYPDYIVRFKNGDIGIYETKSVDDQQGDTVTKAKSKALQGYMEEQSKNGLNVTGGIVRPSKLSMPGVVSFEINTTYDQNTDSEWQLLTL